MLVSLVNAAADLLATSLPSQPVEAFETPKADGVAKIIGLLRADNETGVQEPVRSAAAAILAPGAGHCRQGLPAAGKSAPPLCSWAGVPEMQNINGYTALIRAGYRPSLLQPLLPCLWPAAPRPSPAPATAEPPRTEARKAPHHRSVRLAALRTRKGQSAEVSSANPAQALAPMPGCRGRCRRCAPSTPALAGQAPHSPIHT